MDSNQGWLQKRQFTRVPDMLRVVYYPVSAESKTIESADYKDTTVDKIKEGPSSSFVKAMTEDISEGGLSIVTPEPLSQGSHVVIDLFLPKIAKPVKLLAEVRNVEQNIKSAGSYKAGLKIISVSKSDLKRIEDRIYEDRNK